MRSFLAVSGSMLSMLVMACALDSEPESADDPATTSEDSSELVTVPDELSFDALDGTTAQDHDHGHKRCRVELRSCRDPQYHKPTATACEKGDCKGGQAYRKAREICERFCKPNACRNLVVKEC